MLEKEDLQAIQEMIDTSVTASEQRVSAKIDDVEQRMSAKIDASSQETMRGAALLMEQYFGPKFDLLFENQQLILQKLEGKVDKESCESGMSVVAAAIRSHSRDIEELKAQ